ncbi:MAG: hypothetical protein LUE24_11815 [Lachnospiraceae bacterium]|nr:hypothetical protein [Lachnospiraceae bacterium]
MADKNLTTATETTDLTETSGYALAGSLDFMNNDASGDFAGVDFRLDKIKLPAGGVTAFEMPDPENEGETTLVKNITGVILFQHPANAYYKSAYTGGNNPPDCGSFDGVVGTGDPGGTCAKCPYNQFGSAAGGSKGKACKNRRMMYILMEGDIFPYRLSLPTGSLSEYGRYAKSLLNKRRFPSQVVTSISLQKATSSTDIGYSQAKFQFVRALTDTEKAAVSKMVEWVREYDSNMTMESLVDEDEVPEFVDAETSEVIEPM